MRLVRLTLLAAALAVAISACGSSSKPKPLTASAYIAKVDALCTANNAKENAKAPAGETQAQKTQQIEDETLKTVTAMEAVTPPASLRAKVSAWQATLDREADIQKQATKKLLAGQTQEYIAMVKAATPIADKLRAQAKAVGFKVCGG